MANTQYTINLEYNNAIREADNLDQAADKIKTERGRLSEYEQSVNSAWKGNSATQYLRKVRAIEEDLKNLESKMRRSATVIRDIAERTRQADQHALDLANKRTV